MLPASGSVKVVREMFAVGPHCCLPILHCARGGGSTPLRRVLMGKVKTHPTTKKEQKYCKAKSVLPWSWEASTPPPCVVNYDAGKVQ